MTKAPVLKMTVDDDENVFYGFIDLPKLFDLLN